MSSISRLQAALELARGELLAARAPQGYWVGKLSSSALSTATAICALSIFEREGGRSQGEITALVSRGLAWLVANANADGGWGDTICSQSNLSTTTLCWAAFGVLPGASAQYQATIAKAEKWLRQRVGGLEPDRLAPAVIARYGKDRTFSVPILTMCALAGRLGQGREAWRWVLPLPFELAAFPHRWFAMLRLPVVSYALPALIAIGQAHHVHRPTRNPLLRWARNLTLGRTLRLLAEIQPSSGGFLEATPLTSFVVMSLAGSGKVAHPAAIKGTEFLIASAHADGSWAIDSNLATWLTTLSLNALNHPSSTELATTPFKAAREWLLEQQFKSEHPYTHAAPGGWAWTDLPGGVPDADDTAGALLALRRLCGPDGHALQAAALGITWLVDLQNRDGGMPTFCRGWGNLPFDRSGPDLTAHAVRAWTAWWKDLPEGLQTKTQKAISRAVDYLTCAQKADGSWVPLWFGHEHAPDEENPTYGTARVVLALQELSQLSVSLSTEEAAIAIRKGAGEWANAVHGPLIKGVKWLLESQGKDGGWSGFPQGCASVEETALAVEALAEVLKAADDAGQGLRDESASAVDRGVAWIIERVESGQWKTPSPIGFYFAKLWYYEQLYPMIFTVAALERASGALLAQSPPKHPMENQARSRSSV